LAAPLLFTASNASVAHGVAVEGVACRCFRGIGDFSMIEYESFVYLDVHRTGSGQVIDVLERVSGEKLVRRHRHAPITWGRLWPVGRRKLVFTTVRNPWDWYVSLWAWGVGGRSAIRHGLRRALGRREMEALYYPAEPATFRRWLAAVHDPELASRAMGEQYPQSGLVPVIGLYTYRFQRVTTAYPRLFLRRWWIADAARISSFHARHKAYELVLRSETLNADLQALAREHGQRLGFRPDAASAVAEADRARVHASSRPIQGYRDYYDDAARDLVARRDGFFLEEFGYVF